MRALRLLIRKAVKRSDPQRRWHGRFALEIFSGSSRLAIAMSRNGVPTVSLDIKDDPLLDITQKPLLAYIMHLVLTGMVLFIWLGTPCSTWSTARRGFAGRPGGPLRSLQFPYGVPEALDRPLDKMKIEVGNKTMRVSVQLLRTCVQRGVPCALENPCSSRLFRVGPVAQICRHAAARVHVCDFCQFGCPYRKRTKVVFWHLGMCSNLQRLCTGRHGQCSQTGQPHVILRGNAPGSNKPRTAMAEAYPIPFAKEAGRFVGNQLKFATPPD